MTYELGVFFPSGLDFPAPSCVPEGIRDAVGASEGKPLGLAALSTWEAAKGAAVAGATAVDILAGWLVN
jgi:hypothetical protein